MIGRITICSECGYRALTWDRTKCSKCDGELEIIASTNENDFLKQKKEARTR